jgi:5-methylcytosine-specific restriction endonuclease McrA
MMNGISLLKPKDRPKRREPNPRVLDDGRIIFKKPSEKWTEQRFKVFMRDNGRCVMPKPGGTVCGTLLYFNSSDPFRNAEIDHIKGKKMGGAWCDDRMENLRTSCLACHRDRHDKGRACQSSLL